MTVLLLNPVGLDSRCWESVSLPGQPAVTHEFPGFGGRPREPRLATIAAWADDAAEAVPGDLDVVGVSLGAMVAQHLALRHPHRVNSLFLACTGASGRPGSAEQNIRIVEELGMPGVVDSTLDRWFTPGARSLRPAHPAVEYARRTLLGVDPLAFADGWRVIAGHDVRGQLGGISCLVTCAAAAGDVAAPLPRVEELARGIPGSRLVIVTGPHMAHLEEPDDFSAALAGHLARVHPK